MDLHTGTRIMLCTFAFVATTACSSTQYDETLGSVSRTAKTGFLEERGNAGISPPDNSGADETLAVPAIADIANENSAQAGFSVPDGIATNTDTKTGAKTGAAARVVSLPDQVAVGTGDKENRRAIDSAVTAGIQRSQTGIETVFLDQEQASSVSPAGDLPETYREIASATRANGLFAGRAQLEASDHNLEAHKQTLLPQLRPGASVTDEGDMVASVNVDQVLFDSGRYSATKNILLSEKDNVAANLDVEENDKVSNAISAYIQFHRAEEAQLLVSEVAGLYSWFEKQAESRVANGIGDISEQDLFNLKKIETEAEFETFESEAVASKKKLFAFARIDMPVTKPARMKLGSDMELVNSIQNAPQLKLAAAERDRASNQLEFDKADRLPRVSLNGDVGSATDSFDQEDLDLRVQLSMNQPLNWGFNHGLASSRSQLRASELRYDDTRKELLDRIEILQLEISQAEARIERLGVVMAASKKRLNGFDEQFQAGKAGIVEAASVIETYKKSGMNLIDSKYTIYNRELELASLMGMLTR